MMKNTPIFWLTGMSGSGKSTLASELELIISKSYKICIVDGDDVRDEDDTKLGFGYDDVLINNSRIANYCNNIRSEYDLVIVPVIAPYNDIRLITRKSLDPNFHLVYLKSDIKSLRDRDTKGLYLASDKGLITDLIGYSESNPYEAPANAELVIDTSNMANQRDSVSIFYEYVNSIVSH